MPCELWDLSGGTGRFHKLNQLSIHRLTHVQTYTVKWLGAAFPFSSWAFIRDLFVFIGLHCPYYFPPKPVLWCLFLICCAVSSFGRLLLKSLECKHYSRGPAEVWNQPVFFVPLSAAIPPLFEREESIIRLLKSLGFSDSFEYHMHVFSALPLLALPSYYEFSSRKRGTVKDQQAERWWGLF